MAVIAVTKDPAGLLRQIKSKIDDRKVVTWSYDNDGDLTHSADQWNKKAFFRPIMEANPLRFKFIVYDNQVATRSVYGMYHGRMVEMLTTHFPDVISELFPSLNPVNGEATVVDD